MTALRLSDFAFTPANQRDQQAGLLGFLQLRYGDLLLDGLALRRSSTGRLILSFPRRRTRAGTEFPYLRPVNDRVRRDFEAQVIQALGLERGVA